MHPYPLIRGGGLFLMVMGAGVVGGAVWRSVRWRLVAWSLGGAALVTTIFARGLARPLGQPTARQLVALAGALGLEWVLMRIVGYRFRRGERQFELAVLFVVGLHFLPMALAFGPLLVLLGLLSVANAAAGIWIARETPLLVFWAVDGVMKMAIGALMFFVAPSWTLMFAA